MFVLLLSLMFLGFLCCLVLRQQRTRGASSLLANVYLSILSLLLSLIILECLSGLFWIQSDDFGFTASAKSWNRRYWKPINEQGYRDHPWPASDKTPEKKFGVVIGDSLAAGAGIKHIKDRFNEKLSDMLGPDWRVVCLAKKGWGPIDYLSAVESVDFPTQFVVLFLFINDIENVAQKFGLNHNYGVDRKYLTLLGHSHALNNIYWLIERRSNLQLSSGYWQSIFSLYSNYKIIDELKVQLLQIVQAVQIRTDNFIVVVFPDLRSVKESSKLLAPVKSIFHELGVTTIDLSESWVDIPPNQLVVNRLDSHPNEMVHAAVAERVYKELQRMGL